MRLGLRGLAVHCLVWATLPFWGCGCGPDERSGFRTEPPVGDLLVVNFEKNTPLRYRMVSDRTAQIDLKGEDAARQSRPQTMSERLELVMVYTPIEVDPFGLTTLEVRCESAKVTRSSFSGRDTASDAVESLPQLTYRIEVTPTGEIHDMSSFDDAARQLGQEAFAQSRSTGGRVKNPDMINDLVALQRSLWAAIATVDAPMEGLYAGKQWQGRQLAPWPYPVAEPPTRLTTFTLDRIAEEDGRKIAYLQSTCTLSDEPITDAPRLYEGSFQMRGMFGFLRNYHFKTLTGSGTQVIDMDAGILEKDHQEYTMDVEANFMLPLGGSKPVLTVEQVLSIERIR